MTNIDRKTTVPVEWIIAAIAPTALVVMCFATINSRLARIEERLGMPPYNALNMEGQASACEYRPSPLVPPIYKTLRNDPQFQGEAK